VTLPLLLSVPHAGLEVPDEMRPYCILTADQIARDGDEGAAAIYDLASEVVRCVSTPIARAIVDMNRAEDDRRADGIVKTRTCWDEPIYDPDPPEALLQDLIERYHRPYHRRLTESAQPDVVLGVDCHTMAAEGPPIGPDRGRSRPAVCLSNADGTCPEAWLESLAACLERSFETAVARNDPFRGGFIVRSHAAEMSWVQLELSRGPFLTDDQKRQRVLSALCEWCDTLP
jgi:N-formylglutamate deformylase